VFILQYQHLTTGGIYGRTGQTARKVTTAITYHSGCGSQAGYVRPLPWVRAHLQACTAPVWAVNQTLDYHSYPPDFYLLPPPVPPSSDRVGKCEIPPLPHRGTILVGLTSGLRPPPPKTHELTGTSCHPGDLGARFSCARQFSRGMGLKGTGRRGAGRRFRYRGQLEEAGRITCTDEVLVSVAYFLLVWGS